MASKSVHRGSILQRAVVETLDKRVLLSGDPHVYLTVEAENFDYNFEGAGHAWVIQGQSGFSGSGVQAMESDKTKIEFGDASSAPRLDYSINVPTSGSYYVWVRGTGFDGNSDSVHLGANGSPQQSAGNIAIRQDGPKWSRFSSEIGASATLNFNAGAQTISLFMRESGTSVDAIKLTTDKAYRPDRETSIPTISIAPNTPSSGTITEGSDQGITYTLSRSAAFGDLPVAVSLFSGTAIADDYTVSGQNVDYDTATGGFVVTFKGTETQASFTVHAIADTDGDEGDETLTLAIDESSGDSYRVAGGTETTTTIKDLPVVTIHPASESAVPIREGESGKAAFIVKRSNNNGPLSVTVRVPAVLQGTEGIAAPIADYSFDGYTFGPNHDEFVVSWAADDTSLEKTIYLSAKADVLPEPDETVRAELYVESADANFVIGEPDHAEVVIGNVPLIDLDLNADGDTDDLVDGRNNFRPGYLIDGTRVLDATFDQYFNIVARGLVPESLVTFELSEVSAFLGRSSNSGTDVGFDIELSGYSVTVDSTGTAVMNAKNKDFGGTAKISIRVGGDVVATLDLAKDDDGDGLPNWWENQYGGQNSNSDDDKNIGGAKGAGFGDLLPAIDEFRGFMITDGGLAKHIRTDPTLKDVFISDALNYTIADGGGDPLSLTEKANVVSHRVIANQFNGDRKINFNGDNKQRAIVIEDGPTGGASGETVGPDTGVKPSSYDYVHIRGDYFKSSVELAKGVNAAVQPYVFYDGTTDQNRTVAWQAGGRVKIRDEIIQYETAIAPGSNASEVVTAQVEIPSTGRNIIASGTAAFQQFKVGDEVVSVVAHNAGIAGSSIAAAVAGDKSIIVNGNWSTYAAPPADEVYFVRIGSGETAEWVSYSGRTITDGTVTLTGVTRGLFGTLDRNHAAGTPYQRPSQFIVNRGAFGTAAAAIPVNTAVKPVGVFTNVTRGIANTVAVAHTEGEAIRVFSTDDALRETVAHEFGHAIGMDPHRAGSIMQGEYARGAFLGNGTFEDFLGTSQDEIDAR